MQVTENSALACAAQRPQREFFTELKLIQIFSNILYLELKLVRKLYSTKKRISRNSPIKHQHSKVSLNFKVLDLEIVHWTIFCIRLSELGTLEVQHECLPFTGTYESYLLDHYVLVIEVELLNFFICFVLRVSSTCGTAIISLQNQLLFLLVQRMFDAL